jgi:hypothetical protein
MLHRNSQLSFRHLLGLALLLAPTVCFGLEVAGPYPLQLCTDVTELLVVGTVVGTEDFDPDSSGRVSLVEVRRCLYGDVAEGDTLPVSWRTGREVQADGGVLYTSPSGPHLSTVVGLHIWLLVDADGEFRCSGHPIPVARSAQSRMREYLEWVQVPRIPYGGLAKDPAVARAQGLDPQTGDVIRGLLASYLAGYLDAQSAE